MTFVTALIASEINSTESRLEGLRQGNSLCRLKVLMSLKRRPVSQVTQGAGNITPSPSGKSHGQSQRRKCFRRNSIR